MSRHRRRAVGDSLRCLVAAGAAGDCDHVAGPVQERGHLGTGHGPVGAEIGSVAAAAGDAGCVQCLDAGGVHTVGVHVGEPGGLRGRFEAERPGQERRHLSTGDGPVGAEIGAVAAACGDAGCVQCLDAGGVHTVGVHVGEPGGLRGRFEAERPGQERRHLSTGDVSLGAVVGSVAAADGDALFGEPHDLIGEEAAGDVAEHGQGDCGGAGLAAAVGGGGGDRVDPPGWRREREPLAVA